jgi:hypothetical protein
MVGTETDFPYQAASQAPAAQLQIPFSKQFPIVILRNAESYSFLDEESRP